jgi:osmotically inducible lipoprotein OsmB
MKTLFKISSSIGAVIVLMISLNGCSTEGRDTAIGAGVGGVAGSALTNGSAAGTVGGAVVGGVVGNHVGSH